MTEEQTDKVDERVARIFKALARCKHDDTEDYLADEWAALQVAAVVVAPLYGLDARDEALLVRLQRTAHEALKAECERLFVEGSHLIDTGAL